PKIYDSWLFEKLRKKFSTEEKFERKVISTVDSFIKQTHVLCRDKKMLREGVLYGIFALLISTIRFYLIFLAIGEKMTPMLILLVLSLSVLVSMISVIPGTFGLVESITIGLLVSLHIDPAVAATATLIDRFLHYLLSLSLGGASFLYLEKKYI
ncbi:MAG: flippase-like domain-containing protein, partial [Candidatus Woesearchaeota archaeon]